MGEAKRDYYDVLGVPRAADPEALKSAILLLCHLCWAGEKRQITRAEIIRQIETDSDIDEEDKRKVMAILSEKANHRERTSP